jgi:hypothetical protein
MRFAVIAMSLVTLFSIVHQVISWSDPFDYYELDREGFWVKPGVYFIYQYLSGMIIDSTSLDIEYLLLVVSAGHVTCDTSSSDRGAVGDNPTAHICVARPHGHMNK